MSQEFGMFKALLTLALCGFAVTAQAQAQDRVTLGHARLLGNDAFGDSKDRWQTGSYATSILRGPMWDGSLPTRPGEILEYRLRGQVIAPADLVAPVAGDRRYAGVLAAGLFTHFALAQFETSLGVELVATGPQTGIGNLQRAVHNLLGLPEPVVLGNQIGNAVHPTASAEIGRSLRFGDGLTLRPFAEAQAGVETLARLGGDVVLGGLGRGALMVRDTVTGQRVEGINGSDGSGLSLSFGGDVARVFDSAYLPTGGAATLRDTRRRLRLGLNWQGERAEVFYGLTLLGREFATQPESQVVGSLRLRLEF